MLRLVMWEDRLSVVWWLCRAWGVVCMVCVAGGDARGPRLHSDCVAGDDEAVAI